MRVLGPFGTEGFCHFSSNDAGNVRCAPQSLHTAATSGSPLGGSTIHQCLQSLMTAVY